MDFQKYPSLLKYRKKHTDELTGRQVALLEKIHGSNFSFYCERNGDGQFNSQVGKRTSFLGKDEKFPMVRPFISHDKRKVAELYHHYDIMELFDITRSCENRNGPALNDFEDHCETECWWCYERRWAFGRV